ncbi:MAG TPA: hypothetical protein VII33_08605 [Nakamurella sp.]
MRTAQGRPEPAGERLRRLHEDIDGGLDAGLDAAGYLGQGDRGRPDRVDHWARPLPDVHVHTVRLDAQRAVAEQAQPGAFADRGR